MGKWIVCFVLTIWFITPTVAQDPPARPFPPMTFTGAELLFDAASVTITSQFQPSLTPPNVEHLTPVSPEAALRTWASEKLTTTGTGSALVTLTVRDAVLLEEPLEVTDGVRGWFRRDQAAKYTVRLSAALKVTQANGASSSASASVWRSTTVEEGTDLAELEVVWFRLIEGVVNDFQEALEPEVRAQMAGFLPTAN